ncbi:hypothetical protein CK203_023348 [Vitis vinifera]|uniref:Uncharacterized protein n=1 Tax=Vitis vinifera TaxID=29760 RepID=A0A438J6K1_VITVI|nr:hypothetical protein CK203_023348 [Vitis vinifera]
MLTSLNISNNNISGAMPPQLGKAIRLQQLDLSTNHLNGKIPKESGMLPLLFKLLLGNNSRSFRKKRNIKSTDEDVEDLFAIWGHDGELLYEYIIQGTDNFSSKQCIVTGGYGTVYKAELAQWPPLSKPFSMNTLGELMSHGHGGETS